jgi:hypothetical protein
LIPAARELAGVEMSLVGELGRELFLGDALEPVLGDYDQVRRRHATEPRAADG